MQSSIETRDNLCTELFILGRQFPVWLATKRAYKVEY